MDSLLTDIGFMFDSHHCRSSRSFVFGETSLTLSCIDEDPGHVQSGHHLWPGASILAQYRKWWIVYMLVNNSVVVIQKENEQIKWQRPASVVELGAGCGLCGLLLYKLGVAENVILTDYDPGSLEILRENAMNNTDSRIRSNIVVEEVVWGQPFKFALPVDHSIIVIGSDLIYCPSVVRPLLATAHQLLLAGNKWSKFILVSSFNIGEVRLKMLPYYVILCRRLCIFFKRYVKNWE